MQRRALTRARISPVHLDGVVFSASHIQHVQRSLADEPDLAPDEEAEVKHREEMLEKALEMTFPASDPVSFSA